MMYLATFERFTSKDPNQKTFPLKKPAKLSISIWNIISRGLRAGYITDYKVDYSNDPKVIINYSDNTQFILPLKKSYFTKYVSDKKSYTYDNYVELYSHNDDEKHHPLSIVQLVLKGTRMLKKMKSNTIIGFDGKEYPISEVNRLVKESPLYKELLKYGFEIITNNNEKENGTVVLGKKKQNKWSRSRTHNNMSYDSIHKLTLGGRIKIDKDIQPRYVIPPIKTMKEFEKLLQWVVVRQRKNLKSEIERWKKIIEKNPTREKDIPEYLTHYFWHETAQNNPKIDKLLDSGII